MTAFRSTSIFSGVESALRHASTYADIVFRSTAYARSSPSSSSVVMPSAWEESTIVRHWSRRTLLASRARARVGVGSTKECGVGCMLREQVSSRECTNSLAKRKDKHSSLKRSPAHNHKFQNVRWRTITNPLVDTEDQVSLFEGD